MICCINGIKLKKLYEQGYQVYVEITDELGKRTGFMDLHDWNLLYDIADLRG